MAFEKAESAESGAVGFALVTERPFDVVFLEVQLSGLDGFEVCSVICESVRNRTTLPVVFVADYNESNARNSMSLRGGSDFVIKPVLMSVITAKVLTFALRGRLEKIEPVMT